MSWLAQGLAQTAGPGHAQFWVQGVPSLPYLLPPPSPFFPALTCPCAAQGPITAISMSRPLVEPDYWAALSSPSS